MEDVRRPREVAGTCVGSRALGCRTRAPVGGCQAWPRSGCRRASPTMGTGAEEDAGEEEEVEPECEAGWEGASVEAMCSAARPRWIEVE